MSKSFILLFCFALAVSAVDLSGNPTAIPIPDNFADAGIEWTPEPRSSTGKCSANEKECLQTLQGSGDIELLCYKPSTHVCTENLLCSVGKRRCGDKCYSDKDYACIKNVLYDINNVPAIVEETERVSDSDVNRSGSERAGETAPMPMPTSIPMPMPTPEYHSASSSGMPPMSSGVCGPGEGTCEEVLKETNKHSTKCFDPVTHLCASQLLCPKIASNRCGDSCYSPDHYKCHDDKSLCPIHLGEICDDACYSLSEYRCENGQLVQNFGRN